MKEIKLKYKLGIFLILSHLIIIGSIILLRFINGFSTDELTTLLGIVTPMFAGYTMSVALFLIKDKYRLHFDSKRVTIPYAIFMFLIPSVFVLIILSAIWAKAYNRTFDDFEDFKTFLLIIEGTFAVFIGVFVYSLFKNETQHITVTDDAIQTRQKDEITSN